MKPQSPVLKLSLVAAILLAVSGEAFAQEKAQGGESTADGFLYFKEEPAVKAQDLTAKGPASGAELTADFLQNKPVFPEQGSGILDSTTGFIGLFTPRKLNSQIGLWFDEGVQNDSFEGQFSQYITPRTGGIDLSFHTEAEFISAVPLSLAFNPGAVDAFETKRLGAGLRVQYSGFSADAGFLRDAGAFDELHYGFNLDLTYGVRSWRTSLQVTGLVLDQTNGFIDLGGFYDRSYTVQFDAAYGLTSNWSLTGGLRYTDGRDRFNFDLNKTKADSRVFMGTALTF